MFSSSVYRLIRGAGVAIVTALSFAAVPAQAQSVAEFYKGKSINLVIGFSVGSGYDIYARLLARYMPKHIPGNPMIVPQNMPGAGSVRAAQYIANVAPKDGTVMGAIGRSVPVEPLLGDVKLDGRHFAWIGNIASSNSLCASWHETGIKNWDDLITKPVVLAGQGPGSDLDNFALVLRNVFGAKVKLVSGYPGGNDANLSIERRETDGRCGWSWDSIKSTKPDWLRDNKINLLVVFAMEKASDIPPEVPMILEKARNDEERQILQLHLAGQAFGRPFFAAAEIPADRKAALRAAFDATMKDPEFIAEAKRVQLDVIPSTGAEIDRIMAEIYSTPKHIVEKARLAIKN